MAWYVARTSGIVAYLLLAGSVVLGVLMAARTSFTWPRFAVEELHRFLAILTGVFIGLHGGALLLDTVVPFSLRQELVPFTAGYRPFAVGLGIVAAELTAAVGISNALRPRISRRVWRRLHYLTLPVWAFATLHGLLAGTDRFDPWFAALAGMSIAAAVMAFLTRFSPRRLPA